MTTTKLKPLDLKHRESSMGLFSKLVWQRLFDYYREKGSKHEQPRRHGYTRVPAG